MKRFSGVWLGALLALAGGCSGPAVEEPDATASPDAGIDAAVVEMVDAAMEDDAFVPVDAFVPPDAAEYDGGPPATWDEVYAIFTDARCGASATGCHYSRSSGMLSLATSATACSQLHRPGRSVSCSLRERIVAGDPSASLLYRKLAGPLPSGCGARMPEMRTPLTPEELSVVARWIYAGATCP